VTPNFWALNANSSNSLGGDLHFHERLPVLTALKRVNLVDLDYI